MDAVNKSSILEGFRVVEVAGGIAGSVAGVMLADLGAEVIKVERPGGDPDRAPRRLYGADTSKKFDGQEVNAVYEAINHNKKNITVDLTRTKGRAVLYRLVEKSDILIRSLNQGRASSLSPDYQTLSRHNPRLIYGTISGYGKNGPDSSVLCDDLTGFARSGLMFAAHSGKDPTYLVGILGETITGTMLVQGVLAALIKREQSGEGQEVSVSLLGSMMWLHYSHIGINLLNGQEFQEYIRSEAANPLLNWYRCQDDKWISLSSHQADVYWADHCEVMGIKHLEKDPRFENINVRAEHARELIAIMDRIFATKSRDEWLDIHKRAKGLAVTPLNSVSELLSDPQVRANNYITPFEHPVAGKMLTIGNPVEFSETPGPTRQSAPALGEHTDEVLINLCGYSGKEVKSMAKEGIV